MITGFKVRRPRLVTASDPRWSTRCCAPTLRRLLPAKDRLCIYFPSPRRSSGERGDESLGRSRPTMEKAHPQTPSLENWVGCGRNPEPYPRLSKNSNQTSRSVKRTYIRCPTVVIPSHDDDWFSIHLQSEEERHSEDHTSGRRAEEKSIRVLGLLFPQLGVVYYAMRQREREKGRGLG